MKTVKLKHRGTYNELSACLWFLKQGYDVFRNISPHGTADLIAIKGDVMFKVDVKATAALPAGAQRNCIRDLKPQQIADGVKRFNVYPDGNCELIHDSKSNVLDKRDCMECGTNFMPKTGKKIFCSEKCAIKNYNRRYRNGQAGKGVRRNGIPF